MPAMIMKTGRPHPPPHRLRFRLDAARSHPDDLIPRVPEEYELPKINFGGPVA